MKIFTLFLILLFVQPVFSSTLILKVKKEITSPDFSDLAEVRTRDYKEIRISIKYTSNIRQNALLNLYAVEDNETTLLDSADFNGAYNKILEIPPGKLKIQVKGAGTYTVLVWAN